MHNLLNRLSKFYIRKAVVRIEVLYSDASFHFSDNVDYHSHFFLTEIDYCNTF